MTDPFEPDRPMICPYDSNHSIAASRIRKHLLKCARNYPPDYKVSCPFNESHRLFKSEVQEHIANCPDYQHLDPIIYEHHDKHGAVISCMEDRQSVVDCQESWDEEEGNFFELSAPPNSYSATPLDPVRGNSHEQGIAVITGSNILLKERTLNRAPIGFAEALMIEESGNSVIDDISSVASFQGIGRGKMWNQARVNETLEKIGKARGSGQLKID